MLWSTGGAGWVNVWKDRQSSRFFGVGVGGQQSKFWIVVQSRKDLLGLEEKGLIQQVTVVGARSGPGERQLCWSCTVCGACVLCLCCWCTSSSLDPSERTLVCAWGLHSKLGILASEAHCYSRLEHWCDGRGQREYSECSISCYRCWQLVELRALKVQRTRAPEEVTRSCHSL